MTALLASSAGVFFEREICSRKRHVETSRRDEEMGESKGTGRGRGERRKTPYLFSPLPLPPFPSFALAPTLRVTISTLPNLPCTVIKSKMATTTILRTRTRFRPPKVRLHCRLQLSRPSCKCCVTQKLSSVLYYKTKNPFEGKICLKISFQLL